MIEPTVTVDVREDIRAGREPFARIMEAAASLKQGQSLRLLAPFKPSPLLGVMARRGFSHQARPIGTGDWEVLFARGSGPAAPEQTPATAPSPPACGAALDVDARGLEPPQPLIVVLEALSRLPKCAALRARTDRRPLALYPHLKERGFVGETEAQADGSFVTTIRHA